MQVLVENNSWIKLLVVGSAALLATLSCLYLMLFLIAGEISPSLDESDTPYVRPAITEPREERPIPTRTVPKKVMPLEPPPETEMASINRSPRVDFHAERPTFGSIADIIGPMDVQLQLDAPNSELSPMFVVQPTYPLRATMREIEGYVIVEFSVRENGTVANPRVVESEPGSIFDESALAAISRFKFKPREVGGDPIRVDNVQLKFAFNLDSLYEVNAQ